MAEAHQGRGIREQDFGKVAGIVLQTLKDLGVNDEMQQEVL